jgi:hypothetical protein
MKRLLAFVMVLSCLGWAAPAGAEAWSVRKFRASDWGSRIHYLVTVCSSSSVRLTFTSYLHTDEGVGLTYRATWRDRQRAGCYGYNLSERDRYTEGVWDAQLRIVEYGGAKWTPLRYIDIQ